MDFLHLSLLPLRVGVNHDCSESVQLWVLGVFKLTIFNDLAYHSTKLNIGVCGVLFFVPFHHSFVSLGVLSITTLDLGSPP